MPRRLTTITVLVVLVLGSVLPGLAPAAASKPNKPMTLRRFTPHRLLFDLSRAAAMRLWEPRALFHLCGIVQRRFLPGEARVKRRASAGWQTCST